MLLLIQFDGPLARLIGKIVVSIKKKFVREGESKGCVNIDVIPNKCKLSDFKVSYFIIVNQKYID